MLVLACSASTSSATASATRSTRAPRCASSTDMARFILHRIVSAIARADRDLDPHLPDLPGDPERRPGAAAGRPRSPRRRTCRTSAASGASTSRSTCSTSRRWRRSSTARSSPTRSRSTCYDEIKRDLPATLSLAIGAGIIWFSASGSLFGVLSAMTSREAPRPRAHGARADRRLDAGVLPRRDDALLPRVQGEPLPARRLRQADVEPLGVVLPPAAAMVRPVGAVHRRLLARAALARSSTRSTRTTCEPRAPRASASAG